MSKLRALGQRLSNLNQNQIIQEVLRSPELSEFLIRSNKDNLNKGERTDGSIQPNYSPTSVEIYGKRDIPIQLFDTGYMYDSIEVDIVGEVVKMVADTIKDADFGQIDLSKIYDEGKGKVIGVNAIQTQEATRIIYREAIKAIKKVFKSS